MNSGHVVYIEPYGETVEDASRAGQKTTDGSWDWLAKPTEQYSAIAARDTPDQRAVDYIWGEVTWTTKSGEDKITVTEAGEIRTREETRTIRKAGEFIIAPSERIGVVSDTKAKYYLEEMFTAVEIEESELDLRSLVDALDVDQWGVGFAGRPVDNGGRKGSLYGKKVEDDPDVGDEIQKTPLSDVGFQHLYGTEQLKAYLSSSGYAAAYGDEWTSRDFVPWLVDIVKPHMANLDDEMPEDQSTLEDAAAGGDA